MNIYLKENLKRFDLYDIVDFQRIALTLEQIVKYNILFKPQDLDTMEKLLADNNIKKFCYNLRQSTYYRKIRAKLDKDREYQNLKNNLINHKKIVERLQKKAQKARRIGADPADAYYDLREDLMQKIDYYDFMIVELDALAASKAHPKLLKNMVLEVVDRYFDQEVYEDEM